MGLDPDQFWRQTPRTFARIVRARHKGRFDLAITTAWFVENFHRSERKFKNLDHYLSETLSSEEKQAKRNSKLLSMFKRIQDKGAEAGLDERT